LPKTRPDYLEAILAIARDLTASLAAEDRYARLLDAVRSVLPCDAASLLRLEGDVLVPLAGYGLSPEALAQRYDRRDHPRLDLILRSPDPVRFPPDSPLADPFDGFLEIDPEGHDRIHACLGCALSYDGEIVGALTADARDPLAFESVDSNVLAALGALAGAALRTSALIEALERRAERTDAVAKALQRSAVQLSGEIVGTSSSVRRLLDEIALVASSDLPVLITGETGSGKELVAHRIHASSPRGEAALIHVNCAALPESIAESELFGHVAGAFTGATKDRPGKFEIADGATLFLDEVGELPLSIQPKLLRALEQGEIQRVGSDRTHRVNVRVIAATNRDLPSEVEQGRFRADLFHRLAVFPVRVPPLRDRREDIALLAGHFLAGWRRRLGLGPVRLTGDAKRALERYDWPGNVRELENVVSRAVLRSAKTGERSGTILIPLEHLDLPGATGGAPTAGSAALAPIATGSFAASTEDHSDARTLKERVEDFQREEIRAALARNGGVWAGAARELGMHRSNLHHLAKRLGLLED